MTEIVPTTDNRALRSLINPAVPADMGAVANKPLPPLLLLKNYEAAQAEDQSKVMTYRGVGAGAGLATAIGTGITEAVLLGPAWANGAGLILAFVAMFVGMIPLGVIGEVRGNRTQRLLERIKRTGKPTKRLTDWLRESYGIQFSTDWQNNTREGAIDFSISGRENQTLKFQDANNHWHTLRMTKQGLVIADETPRVVPTRRAAVLPEVKVLPLPRHLLAAVNEVNILASRLDAETELTVEQQHEVDRAHEVVANVEKLAGKLGRVSSGKTRDAGYAELQKSLTYARDRLNEVANQVDEDILDSTKELSEYMREVTDDGLLRLEKDTH